VAAEKHIPGAPSSLETEEALLGAVLLDPLEALPKVLETGLKPEDFFKEAHTEIFRAVQGLDQARQPVDQVTTAEALKSRGTLDKCGGPAYLARLYDGIGLAANVAGYARTIIDRAILRRLISLASAISEECRGAPPDADEVLDRAEAAILKVRGERASTGFLSVAGEMERTFRGLMEMRSKYKDGLGLTGLSSGFGDLDALTGGFQRTDLVILAGRPSMGKTALALNLALNAAIPDRRQLYRQLPAAAVAVFSLEMGSEQLLQRLICQAGHFNLNDLRTGRLSDQDTLRLTSAISHLDRARIFIDDTPAIRILELRAKARRLKSQLQSEGSDLGLVVVDYLQLMRGSDRADSREQEISEISRSLKTLAKELNLPVLALSQLNRKVEERPNKTPQLADLRESGAIEQDADLITFIYRPEVYKTDDETLRGQAELIIGKHRNGPTGKVRLYFKAECSSFLPPDNEVQ
jgi:replicative DNA helicase